MHASHWLSFSLGEEVNALGKFVLAGLLAVQAPISVEAQRAPTSAEIIAYDGLFKAAHEGNREALARLLAAGADVEERDGSGRTPLHVAAHASHREIVEALIEAGAEPNVLDDQAYDIVTIAAVANDHAILNVAIELGASAGNVTSPYEGTALIAAAHLGHHEIVRTLIEAGAPLDHINNLHWTALMESVVLGDGGPDHVKTARYLLEAGANKSIADRNGVTPYEHALSRGYSAMVELLK